MASQYWFGYAFVFPRVWVWYWNFENLGLGLPIAGTKSRIPEMSTIWTATSIVSDSTAISSWTLINCKILPYWRPLRTIPNKGGWGVGKGAIKWYLHIFHSIGDRFSPPWNTSLNVKAVPFAAQPSIWQDADLLNQMINISSPEALELRWRIDPITVDAITFLSWKCYSST